jgi:hypothetical protein
MIVYVEGSCPKKQQIAYDVIGYCYNQLIPKHDVDIFLNIKSIKSHNTYGWCQHNYTNNFDISIEESLTISQLIKTICHEMVHVKQGVTNELVEKYTTKYQRLWKGTTCDEYDISSLPWELEAYKLEEELFDSFMEQYNEKI